MADVFLEIVFNAADFVASGFEGRDEIEDELEESLSESDIGEITGGGAGSGAVIIDVEIKDEKNLKEALSIIRQVLRGLNVPKSTIITRSKPTKISYSIYE